MQYAVIENNQVVRLADWTPPINCKIAGGLPVARPVEGDPPAYNAALEQLAGPTYQIEPTKVVRKWTVERLPLAAQQAAVKAEARRRILARYPEWKQANMLARDGELQAIQLGTMRDDAGNAVAQRALTDAEKAEHVAIRKGWDWVKSVRVASDTLEAANPIPLDFTDNKHWPA